MRKGSPYPLDTIIKAIMNSKICQKDTYNRQKWYDYRKGKKKYKPYKMCSFLVYGTLFSFIFFSLFLHFFFFSFFSTIPPLLLTPASMLSRHN